MKLSRWLIVAVAGASALGSLASEPRTLTLKDRVRAQEAIERVCFNHRIWPKENPQPKPPFEQMVPKAIIEAKVTDYLKKCAALEKYWHRPIRPEQLQAEMDRMAKQTKDRATLKELFAALGNDPTLVAECLARPVLADRLIHNWYANDTRIHVETRKRAERALTEALPTALAVWPEGEFHMVTCRLKNEKNHETRTPSRLDIVWLDKAEFQSIIAQSSQPGRLSLRETREAFLIECTARQSENAIVLESLAFRKQSFTAWYGSISTALVCSLRQSADEKFWLPSPKRVADSDSSAGTWLESSLTHPDGPEARYWHSAVWTGTEMIVWGGTNNRGGRYNPSTDTWEAMSAGLSCPSQRMTTTAVWTGSEMIIWGGNYYDIPLNTGGRYNPSSDTWAPISKVGNCPSARSGHTAVWTGSQMIVWGGYGDNYLGTGGRYDPTTDSWTATSNGLNCPEARRYHTAVWTGSEMIVWGGYRDAYPFLVNTGGRYNPSTDTWMNTSTGTNCPLGRAGHSAVWTGNTMVVWGGQCLSGAYFDTQTGGQYNPSTDTWTATSTGESCPAARDGHSALWTGTDMIVWGGGIIADGDWTPINTGGRYRPSTDSWTATSTGANCPSAREGYTAVWTGTEMIIWGGRDYPDYSRPLDTGGRYDPSADVWVPTSTQPYAPLARGFHTATWTGSEMIIWGGYTETYPNLTETGGRYSLVTDAWTPTSTGDNCPSARLSHTAIWTGTEMIVWGGWDDIGAFNTGGRYDPASDTWTATSTENACPAPRGSHTAVWTGTEMIVWGGVDWDGTTTYFNTGGRYDPSADLWTPTSTGNACPSARCGHTGIWTGAEMIVWGGIEGNSGLNTGGKYSLESDSWKGTSTESPCPSPRTNHTAVWTGSEMVVWGGLDNLGGRYDPRSDSWIPVSPFADCSWGRSDHTAVWAGEEMIVWGGWSPVCPPAGPLNTGGRYDPLADTWTWTSSGVRCPSARYGHSAVWTGTEMIVWGGVDNAGGIYVPTGPCPLVTPYPSLLPDGMIGQQYGQVLSATGGTGPYLFEAISGSLPPGLFLDGTGVLSGVPTDHGTFLFTVMVTDAGGCAGSADCSLTTAGPPPVIASLSQASNPFRIVVKGSNLKQGIQVSINNLIWYNVTWKNSGKIVIKGGKSLKAAVPKGVDTVFTFVNPDGGEASVTWHW